MKRVLLTLILLCVGAYAQGPMPFRFGGNGGCYPPSGTTYTEWFGDGGSARAAYSSPSGTAGMTTQWARVAGTPDSIAASPASAIANTACGFSLHMTQPGGVAGNIDNIGFAPLIPLGTYTFGFSFMQASNSLATSGSQRIFGIGVTSGSSSNDGCTVVLYNNAGTITLRAFGTSNSSSTGTLTAPANTWRNVSLKCVTTDTTTKQSCISTSGDLSCCGTGSDNAGTCYRFDARAKNGTIISVGDSAVAVASSYYLGNLWVNSSAGSMSGQSMFMDMECTTSGTCTDGTTLASTNLNGSTWSGNGTWTVPAAGWVVSTAFNLPLVTAENVSGTSRDGSGTHSMKFDHSGTTNPAATYTFTTTSANAGYSFHFRSSWDPTSGDVRGFTFMQNVAGTDFAGANLANNGSGRVLSIETFGDPSGNPIVGTKYAYSLNTEYIVVIGYNNSGNHTMDVYDTSCNLLSHQEKAALNTGSLPSTMQINLANTPGARTGITYVDSVTVNTKGESMTCH